MGGAQIDKSRVQFLTALEQIVELASLQVCERQVIAKDLPEILILSLMTDCVLKIG